MNTPEIKAGQRWNNNSTNISITVIYCDGECVLYKYDDERLRKYVTDLKLFLESFTLIPQPKTRDITKDDVLKMLAVNPVLFMRPINKCGTIAFWSSTNNPVVWLENTKNNLSGYQYSHNPFAPNPVVVGPEIEVTE